MARTKRRNSDLARDAKKPKTTPKSTIPPAVPQQQKRAVAAHSRSAQKQIHQETESGDEKRPHLPQELIDMVMDYAFINSPKLVMLLPKSLEFPTSDQMRKHRATFYSQNFDEKTFTETVTPRFASPVNLFLVRRLWRDYGYKFFFGINNFTFIDTSHPPAFLRAIEHDRASLIRHVTLESVWELRVSFEIVPLSTKARLQIKLIKLGGITYLRQTIIYQLPNLETISLHIRFKSTCHKIASRTLLPRGRTAWTSTGQEIYFDNWQDPMTHEYVRALMEEQICLSGYHEWERLEKVKIAFLYDESEDWSEGDSLESRLEAIYNSG